MKAAMICNVFMRHGLDTLCIQQVQIWLYFAMHNAAFEHLGLL